MDIDQTNRALRLSVIDGALSAVMGSLAGGIFLMGFALKILNASAQQVGILASLPFFANLAQIFGSIIIEKTGRKKVLCFFSLLVSRTLWILVILLPFAIFAPLTDSRIWVLVGVIAASSVFASLSGVSWLAWMSDLVPENIRGSYFGRRNMIASACGMVVVLLGGKFITMWEGRFSAQNAFGFILLFIAGLASGLAAVWFLWRIPETESTVRQEGKSLNFSLFFQPLKDRNFLTLILFVSAWMFAIQIAAPFYGVFMIEHLKIDFSNITIFGTFATLATLFMMKIWGPISDKMGNKPIIIVSGWILILVPFIWILALPGKYYLPVLTAHLLSGAFMAGVSLSQFNILIKLSPKEGRSVYLALFAAITGFVGAVAPIVGGSISKMTEGINFNFYSYNISNLQLIFLLSSALQILTIFFILKVKEPAAATPVAVIMQLKNDLNPQAGIGGTADFLMVELKKGEGVLRKLDRVTDELAGRSEQQIGKVLDKGEKIVKKPWDKIKDFFRED
ncbi:MAG: MFS transporter [Candidatus Omnitrophota bacterium]|nr:MAG: MFS transporter [Candidatus Omnitrophota bacterium]